MVCTSLETAQAAVVELVEDFAASEAHYLSPERIFDEVQNAVAIEAPVIRG